MIRPPYTLARACTRADEVYFHRANLVQRLRCLARMAGGGQPVLIPAQLGRAAIPNGMSVSAGVLVAGQLVHLGYVLRPGFDARELRDLLRADLDGRQEWEAA